MRALCGTELYGLSSDCRACVTVSATDFTTVLRLCANPAVKYNRFNPTVRACSLARYRCPVFMCCVCVCACVRARARARVCACERACVRACACVCVNRVCVRALSLIHI